MSGKIRMLIILMAGLVVGIFCSPASAQTIEELYRKAAQEKSINFYGTLAQVNAEKILPVFEKRYPGVKLNHVDITSDSLVARATAEARGGKTLGDIFQAPLETAIQMNDQKLLLEVTLPEYSVYPAIMKGPYWVASNLQFIVVAWNTNLLKKADESRNGSTTWRMRSTKGRWWPSRGISNFSWASPSTSSKTTRRRSLCCAPSLPTAWSFIKVIRS